MLRRQFAKLVSLSPFAIAVVSAQSTAVSGGFYDKEEKPVPGADVIFSNTTQRLLFSTLTDDKGRFSLTGIPVGTYHAQAFAAGPQLRGDIPQVELPSKDDIRIYAQSQLPPPAGAGGGTPGGGRGRGPGGPRGAIPVRAALGTGNQEDGGYALYSYLLFGSQPSGDASVARYREAIRGYVEVLPPVVSVALPPNRLNITYLPQRQQTPVPGAQSGSAVDSLLARYDYGRSAELLAKSGGGLRLSGPYLVSVLTPLSITPQPPQHSLLQDLSTVPSTLITPWIKHFMIRATMPDSWDSPSLSQFALELRTGIEIVALAIPDVKSAYSDWKKVLATLIKSS